MSTSKQQLFSSALTDLFSMGYKLLDAHREHLAAARDLYDRMFEEIIPLLKENKQDLSDYRAELKKLREVVLQSENAILELRIRARL